MLLKQTACQPQEIQSIIAMPRTLGYHLQQVPIAEDLYKIDLAIVDRYQAFSGELLRLSLLGITGYGFLLSNIVFKHSDGVLLGRLGSYATSLGVGLLGLGFAAVFALGHRYLSTDCVTHHTRLTRLMIRGADPMAENSHVEMTGTERNPNWIARSERMSLRRDLKLCNRALLASSFCLALGAASVVWTFAGILFKI